MQFVKVIIALIVLGALVGSIGTAAAAPSPCGEAQGFGHFFTPGTVDEAAHGYVDDGTPPGQAASNLCSKNKP